MNIEQQKLAFSSDQLLIRVGKACNFKCNFCNVADNEKNVKFRETIQDIVRNFHYKLKYSNLDSGYISITISGGEPSIFQKETIFAIKYATKILARQNVKPIFDIQTNGSNVDIGFAKKLYSLGVDVALVSFHTSNPEIFERVIQVSYKDNFYKIIEGIHNLQNAGIEVFTNTILSNQNKDDFLDTIKFLVKEIPKLNTYHMGLIQPHGEAEKVLDKVYPRYEEVADIYNNTLEYLRINKKEVVSHYVGLPACYITNLDDSLEVSENIGFRQNFNFSEKYLINNINDNNKVQTLDCSQCLYNNVCSGIWKEYVGLQKLKPKAYIIDRNNNFTQNNFAYKLKKISENIQELYRDEYKQLLIPINIAPIERIYSYIREATKIGFFDISLIIDKELRITQELLMSGVTNIQMKAEYIQKEDISKMINFSKTHGPQFRIDLDIFIDDFKDFNCEIYKNNLYVSIIDKQGRKY